eukprot:356907-Chlamydomonas_euryale.AAC.4
MGTMWQHRSIFAPAARGVAAVVVAGPALVAGAALVADHALIADHALFANPYVSPPCEILGRLPMPATA